MRKLKMVPTEWCNCSCDDYCNIWHINCHSERVGDKRCQHPDSLQDSLSEERWYSEKLRKSPLVSLLFPLLCFHVVIYLSFKRICILRWGEENLHEHTSNASYTFCMACCITAYLVLKMARFDKGALAWRQRRKSAHGCEMSEHSRACSAG